MKTKNRVNQVKKQLPRDLQRIFKFHYRTDMGNAKTAERPDDFYQCLFIRRIKYRYRCVPANEQVPVDELYFLGILVMLPEARSPCAYFPARI